MNRISTLCMILTLVMPAYPQAPEAMLRAAMDRELADGDLKGAIVQYQKILDLKTAARDVKAKALLHQADCHRKLGNEEARRLYERLLKDYSDQTQIAAEARARIGSASQMDAGVRERFLFGGADVHQVGRSSRDGRFLTYQPKGSEDWWYYDMSNGTRGLLSKKQGMHNDSRPIPSPDGRRAARAISVKPREFENYQIQVVSRGGDLGVNVTPDTSFYRAFVADWHPFKDELIVIAHPTRERGSEIVIVDVAKKTKRVAYVHSEDQPSSIAQALFSADGSYIAFNSTSRQESYISMVPTAGGQTVRIAPSASTHDILGFTGNRLVYVSRVSGTNDVWSVPVRDGKPDGPPEVVRKQIGEYNFIGITPTGTLLYGVATRPEELFSADLVPSAAPKLLATPYTGAAHGPAYSPDGRFLAYVSGPYDSQQVRIRELATGIETTQNITLRRFMKLRWFPDGKSLLIMGAATRGQTGFYRYDLATKQVAPLFQFGGESRQDAASTAVPTPDGQSFVFKRTNGKDWSAVSIGDLSNGPVRDILRMEVPRYMRMFALSPDGKNLAISFRDGTFDKIAIMPSSGGEMRVIYEYPKDEYARAWGALAWSAEGKHVLYQRPYKSIMDQAWRVPAAGGTPEPLFTSEIIREFAVHPDGKTITWQANSQYFDVYSLENLVKAGR